ncbi:formylglycine-generating enzyme family protein [Chitinimonas sp.]|uniref:formylglycine-generating enzyme family protein n=1 Tax=Chitinimonas sp. TaxID=1934313 RepID=UPI0035AFDE8B
MKRNIALILSIAYGLGMAHAAEPIIPAMMSIAGGQFTMGNDEKPAASPAHEVTVKPFKLAKYEVTVSEFRRFVEATGYMAPEKCGQMAGKEWFDMIAGSWKSHTLTHNEFEPIVCIGAAGADAYVQWLARTTGKNYRLPTAAEWEYAARAGSRSKFFFGDDANKEAAQVCRYGNIADRSAEAAIKRDFDGLESKDHVGVAACDDLADYASVVGMFEPNAWGLHDTIGNVSEYVQDCGHKGYKGAPTDGSPWMDVAACKTRELRGGNWHWPAFGSASRTDMSVDFIGALEGLRIALDGDEPASKNAATREFEAALLKAQADERDRRASKKPL